MPNIGTVLRTEITRLARRAMRPLFVPLKKDVAALKRALAQQKRLVAKLQRDNARLVADLNSRLAAPPSLSEKELKGSRISPRLVRSQRKRLGLSRVAFAKLLGVSAGAVLAWEGGKSKPRVAAKAAIVAIRKLGKREAQRRLEVLEGASRDRKAPAAKRKGGARGRVRATAKG